MDRQRSRVEEGSPAAVESYAIFDPRQCSLLSVFLSLFPDAPAPAIRCSPSQSLREAVDSSWQVKFAMLMMVLLLAVARILALVGRFVELWLNTFQINGGLLQLGFKLVTGSGMAIPVEGSVNYWSFVGLLDPRTDLLLQQSCDEFTDPSSFFGSESPASKLIVDACLMASKLVYENALVITKVVTEDWKMHVVDIFDCVNTYQPNNPTRLMIVMDRAENAQAIIVAFRGLVFHNSYDWSSCFDFSWYELPGIGRIHVGCLEALSLVDRRDMASFTRLKRNIAGKVAEETTASEVSASERIAKEQSLPEEKGAFDAESDAQEFKDAYELDGHALDHHELQDHALDHQELEDHVHDRHDIEDHALERDKEPMIVSTSEKGTSKQHRPFLSGLPEAGNVENKNLLAYDAACHKLKNLLAVHKDAKVFIAGHSLGGAVATLFTSFLFHTKEDQITSRLAGVYTFGQPKVGNTEFAADMTVKLNHPENRFFRVVYSNDLVSRLPYDDLVIQFKHLGPCFFYSSNYDGETVQEEPPAKNMSSANLLPSQAAATWELLQSLLLRYKFGDAYKETLASTMFRLFGLLIPGIGAHSPVNYIHAIRLGPGVLDAEVMPNP